MFKNKSNKANKAAKREQKPEGEQQQVFKQDYFSNYHRTYSCIHCRAHLANHDELVSKLFQGNHGRAYLFNKVVNIGCKQAVQRELLTGLHAVADIYCDSCETTLGWKYEQAFVPSQKYKEGKYIIELVHMLKENNWDLTSYNTRELLEEANILEKKKQQQKKEFEANNFKVGNNNFIGSSRYDFNSEPKSDPNETYVMCFESISECSNVREQTGLSNLTNGKVDPGKTRYLPPNLNANDENDVAAQEEIQVVRVIFNDGIELTDRSVGRLQKATAAHSQSQPTTTSTIVTTQESYQYGDNRTFQNLMASPKDSLCSSHSQSDLSSSVSITDSSCTDEAPNQLNSIVTVDKIESQTIENQIIGSHDNEKAGSFDSDPSLCPSAL